MRGSLAGFLAQMAEEAEHPRRRGNTAARRITMNEAAYFIHARAQSLSYEAVQFRATAKTALAWLHRAVAWAAGTRGFVDGLAKVKKRYTIREIIKLTQGRYGNQTFEQFFANKN